MALITSILLLLSSLGKKNGATKRLFFFPPRPLPKGVFNCVQPASLSFAIGVMSYNGQIRVSVGSNGNVMTDPQLLVDCIHHEMDGLLHLVEFVNQRRMQHPLLLARNSVSQQQKASSSSTSSGALAAAAAAGGEDMDAAAAAAKAVASQQQGDEKGDEEKMGSKSIKTA